MNGQSDAGRVSAGQDGSSLQLWNAIDAAALFKTRLLRRLF
ncbi:MAG: hypothetical protein ACHQAZ_09755 [Gammaproteobacteria bacterium]